MTYAYLVSLVLILAMFGATVVTSAVGMAFVNGYSLLTTVGGAVVLVFANFSLPQALASFRRGFARSEATRAQLRDAMVFFDALRNYLLFAGFIGTVFGWVAILGGMPNTTPTTPEQGLSLSLLTSVYALILVFVVTTPFKIALRRRLVALG